MLQYIVFRLFFVVLMKMATFLNENKSVNFNFMLSFGCRWYKNNVFVREIVIFVL